MFILIRLIYHTKPSGQDGAILPVRDSPLCPVCRIINHLLTRLDRSGLLNIGRDLFLRVYGPRLSLDQ